MCSKTIGYGRENDDPEVRIGQILLVLQALIRCEESEEPGRICKPKERPVLCLRPAALLNRECLEAGQLAPNAFRQRFVNENQQGLPTPPSPARDHRPLVLS